MRKRLRLKPIQNFTFLLQTVMVCIIIFNYEK